jgi:hypothetical protein
MMREALNSIPAEMKWTEQRAPLFAEEKSSEESGPKAQGI